MYLKQLLIIAALFLQSTIVLADSKEMDVLTDGLEFSDNRDARVAINVWTNELVGKYYDGKVILNFKNNKKEAINNFLSGASGYLAANAFHYIEQLELLKPHTASIYSFQPTSDNHFRYVLVTKNDPKMTNITQLKNKKLGVEETAYLQTLYANSELLKNNLSETNTFFEKTVRYKTHSKALLKLFFNKIDVCIIPEYTWNTMIEINPQIKKKLKILHRSEKIFIASLGLISKRMDSKLHLAHNKSAAELPASSRGRQVLTLLKTRNYKEISDEILAPMIAFYQNYKKSRAAR